MGEFEIVDSATKLVCYDVKLAKGGRRERTTVYVGTMFGGTALTEKKEAQVFIPSMSR